MRATRFHIFTLKEDPADAEIISQKLMVRAGLIKKIAAGIYLWTPLGLRSLRKVEAIVREEMNRAGALELLMPAVQPAELWQASGRWDAYGPELLRFKDRHQRDFVIGPTHEEVITDYVRREIKSYRQLPKHFYQIQSKFRDEVRPRFGVMRAREFVMKDSYSFHATYEDLEREYRQMFEVYTRIFTRIGLNFRAVAADTGAIGGTASHEFHVIAETGEDTIAYCPTSEYAANLELAEALPPPGERPAPMEPLRAIPTPGVRTIAELVSFLHLPVERTVKSIVVESEFGEPVLLLLRGDHELNPVKASKLPGLKQPLTFADEALIRTTFGAGPGSLGPVHFSGRIIADRTVAKMADFVTGANRDDVHYFGVNIGRDFPEPEVADLRHVVAGDPSPDGKGTLALCRGIEVGHIFQLRTKYSAALGCTFLDEAGQEQPMEMGCYGIGISRILGAAIEQNHDERGIIWPEPIAPFEAVICPIGSDKNPAVDEVAERILERLITAGIDAILDDRGERPGVMFADWELIGIPWRVVVSERSLAAGKIEIRHRRAPEAELLPEAEALERLIEAIHAATARI